MCGRYSLAAHSPGELFSRFSVTESPAVERRFNIAPGTEVPALTTDREGRPRAEMLRWGLVPSWSEDPGSGFRMINARAETLAQRPAFRTALERFRCLIPADGFYEWQRLADGARRQPCHVTRADHELFAFAGLWSVWHRGDVDELRTCTIVTTAANATVAAVHDRMPVILPRAAERAWLAHDTASGELAALLVGLPAAELELRPVGPAVNDARCDGPECLLAPPNRRPPAQGSLFGS